MAETQKGATISFRLLSHGAEYERLHEGAESREFQREVLGVSAQPAQHHSHLPSADGLCGGGRNGPQV